MAGVKIKIKKHGALARARTTAVKPTDVGSTITSFPVWVVQKVYPYEGLGPAEYVGRSAASAQAYVKKQPKGYPGEKNEYEITEIDLCP